MYIHLGRDYVLNDRDIIGIFNLETTTNSPRGREFLNLFLKEKINPMVGAAGISAFPMSSRVVQKLALSENPQNILIMHAAGANVSGQIASAIAGGLMITLVSAYL